MMVPQIKSIQITDAPADDPSTFTPDNVNCFCVHFELLIGPMNAAGEEIFQLAVCSPQWLAEECERHGFVLGRHYIVVARYDFMAIRALIEKLVQNCSGESWKDVAARLSRIALWEFEDYRET
jgi:hypothetical protein